MTASAFSIPLDLKHRMCIQVYLAQGIPWYGPQLSLAFQECAGLRRGLFPTALSVPAAAGQG